MVNSEIYLPQANEDILEMAEKYPDRIIPFCNVDPRAISNCSHAPLDRVLAYYKEKGCRGVGEIMPNLPTEDERVQNLFRCAAKVGLPVTWDGSDRLYGDFGLQDDPGIPQFERTLNRFPDLQVFAHGPIFWTELSKKHSHAERKPVFNDDGDPLYVMDQIKDMKNTDAKWIENLSLSEAMKKLSPREQHIINLRFFEGKTQMEVADEISISQAQVSRLEKNALNYMKKYV